MFGIIEGTSHLNFIAKFSIEGFKHGMGHGANDGGMNPMNLLYVQGHEFVYYLIRGKRKGKNVEYI